MKILEIIPSLGTGGGQDVCTNLCCFFAKEPNIQVFLLTFFDGGEAKYLERIKGNRSIVFKSLGKKEGFRPFFIDKLSKEIAKINPDIIHTHLGALPYVLASSKNKKYKIYHTIHTIPSKEQPPLSQKLIKFRVLCKWDLTFVGISKTNTENAKKIYPKSPVVNINNGIDIHVPAKKGGPSFDFVSCGRLEPPKNFSLLISSFYELEKINPNVNLLIIGGGSLERELKEQTHKMGLDNFVKFSGNVEDPLPLIAMGRIFILTSTREGNPITILEAMSLGLPIVAPRIGGIPDIVSAKNGFLFPQPITSVDLSKFLGQILSDSETLEKMGSNNKIDVSQYTTARMGNDYLSVFFRGVNDELSCK